jgi:hypothetical protein
MDDCATRGIQIVIKTEISVRTHLAIAASKKAEASRSKSLPSVARIPAKADHDLIEAGRFFRQRDIAALREEIAMELFLSDVWQVKVKQCERQE